MCRSAWRAPLARCKDAAGVQGLHRLDQGEGKGRLRRSAPLNSPTTTRETAGRVGATPWYPDSATTPPEPHGRDLVSPHTFVYRRPQDSEHDRRLRDRHRRPLDRGRARFVRFTFHAYT